MKKTEIELFDTTLRDGTQGEGITLSINDKIIIARKLDEFGIDIIEGGWPGSNPKDEEFFARIKKIKLSNSRLCAFGSTARFPDRIKNDPNLNALLKAETPYVSIFGKTWEFHSRVGLGISEEANEALIYDSVRYLKEEGRIVVFDAEHFFDGFKNGSEFSLRMIKAAESAGVDVITLCDTNGGTLPGEVFEITQIVVNRIKVPAGIHTHNDGELAVANSIAAVEAGAVHVQGTINGVGERCGNANLISLIPSLILKKKLSSKNRINLENLTSVSNFISEIMNITPNPRAAYVGRSAFAHKGGIHVSAVMKESKMYEHIEPCRVGNIQRALVSDLSGQSNIKYKAKELGVDISGDGEFCSRLVKHIKNLEYEGFQFDGAEASFELLLRTEKNEFTPYFETLESKVNVVFTNERNSVAEAVIKIEVNGEIEHTASNGHGPVNALDNALRKALIRFYPEISLIKLVDYKVRVLNEKDATEAKVRVLIQTGDGIETWSTVGVSENIIEASWQALCDSFNYKLFKLTKEKENKVI